MTRIAGSGSPPPQAAAGPPEKATALDAELQTFNGPFPAKGVRYHLNRVFQKNSIGLRTCKTFVFAPLEPAPASSKPTLVAASAAAVRRFFRGDQQAMHLLPLDSGIAVTGLDVAQLPAILAAAPASWASSRLAHLGWGRFSVPFYRAPGVLQQVNGCLALPADAAGIIRAPRRHDGSVCLTPSLYEQAFIKLAAARELYDTPARSLLLPAPWLEGEGVSAYRGQVIASSMEAVLGVRAITVDRRTPQWPEHPLAFDPVPRAPAGTAPVGLLVFAHPARLPQQPFYNAELRGVRRGGLLITNSGHTTPSLAIYNLDINGEVLEQSRALVLSNVPYAVHLPPPSKEPMLGLSNPFQYTQVDGFADSHSSILYPLAFTMALGCSDTQADLDKNPQPADFVQVLQRAALKLELPVRSLRSIAHSITWAVLPKANGPAANDDQTAVQAAYVGAARAILDTMC